MKAFVTGATGFVGSHVCERLVALGHTVVALARRGEQFAALERLGAAPVQGSLSDRASLLRAVDGCDIVVHVAGLTAGSDAELHQVNSAGTELLAAAAREAAPALRRFVYVSSQAALGPSQPGAPLAEDAPCRPVTAYGRSKLAGERATMASGLPWAIVRPPSVYGPRDREFLQLFKLARCGIAPVFGTGAQQLSLVYAPELADAIARAALSDQAAGRIYHAAHSEVLTSAEVARAAGSALGRRVVVLPLPGAVAAPLVGAIGVAARALGRKTVLTRSKMNEFLAPAWLLDSSRARRELQWEPRTTASEGFAATAAWYREKGWL